MSTIVSSLAVGDEMPKLVLPPVTRHTLALFCGSSGDHNPLHTDIDNAKAAGLPDVIAHGMLSMAYLGRALTAWIPQDRLRSYSVRFASPTQIRDVVTCSGSVVEKLMIGDESCVRIALQTRTQNDVVTLVGEAVVALA